MRLPWRRAPQSTEAPRSRDQSPAATALLSDSPPLSPTLPSVFHHFEKKSAKISRKSALQWTIWLVACLALVLVAVRILDADQRPGRISYASGKDQSYQFNGGDELPQEPSAISLTSTTNTSKWTVSIPPHLSFPLQPQQYSGLCEDAAQLSHHMAMKSQPKSKRNKSHAGHHSYYYEDPHFLDIEEAEASSVLPGVPWSQLRPKHCERSLTYVLETSSPSLGKQLLSMWLAYGLAQVENRTFFVDDTRWHYGSWDTYFQPPAEPDCVPPPKTQIVPCPHQARHLMVSIATTRHTFGHMFTNEFEDPKKMGVLRQHKIFAMMRAGFEALFDGKLNGDDRAYLEERVAELNDTIRHQGEEIGVHIRRGDLHPMEYQYQKSYIPVEKYLDKAWNISGNPESSQILLATDDPDVYKNNTEFAEFGDEKNHRLRIQKAQTHVPIPPAWSNNNDDKNDNDRTDTDSSSSSSSSTGAESDDENISWSGGFTKEKFWSFGTDEKPDNDPDATTNEDTAAAASLEPKIPSPPSSAQLTFRSRLARSYFLDLAVLAQTDHVVCAVSSYGCRVLAVMMGWERGILSGLEEEKKKEEQQEEQQEEGGGGEEGGNWVNVDGRFAWRGIEW